MRHQPAIQSLLDYTANQEGVREAFFNLHAIIYSFLSQRFSFVTNRDASKLNVKQLYVSIQNRFAELLLGQKFSQWKDPTWADKVDHLRPAADDEQSKQRALALLDLLSSQKLTLSAIEQNTLALLLLTIKVTIGAPNSSKTLQFSADDQREIIHAFYPEKEDEKRRNYLFSKIGITPTPTIRERIQAASPFNKKLARQTQTPAPAGQPEYKVTDEPASPQGLSTARRLSFEPAAAPAAPAASQHENKGQDEVESRQRAAATPPAPAYAKETTETTETTTAAAARTATPAGQHENKGADELQSDPAKRTLDFQADASDSTRSRSNSSGSGRLSVDSSILSVGSTNQDGRQTDKPEAYSTLHNSEKPLASTNRLVKLGSSMQAQTDLINPYRWSRNPIAIAALNFILAPVAVLFAIYQGVGMAFKAAGMAAERSGQLSSPFRSLGNSKSEPTAEGSPRLP